ncbi:hypothetical protein [Paenibacillus thalictri]|uniref:hypothetical protein n=1 Tax=Paenibacillus thalictri TaxID=2527873 RepID=UPI0013EEEA45|nr:hypothetical protein [Paenibacillus thalictri]
MINWFRTIFMAGLSAIVALLLVTHTIAPTFGNEALLSIVIAFFAIFFAAR